MKLLSLVERSSPDHAWSMSDQFPLARFAQGVGPETHRQKTSARGLRSCCDWGWPLRDSPKWILQIPRDLCCIVLIYIFTSVLPLPFMLLPSINGGAHCFRRNHSDQLRCHGPVQVLPSAVSPCRLSMWAVAVVRRLSASEIMSCHEATASTASRVGAAPWFPLKNFKKKSMLKREQSFGLLAQRLLREIRRLDIGPAGTYTTLCYIENECLNACGIDPKTNHMYCNQRPGDQQLVRVDCFLDVVELETRAQEGTLGGWVEFFGSSLQYLDVLSILVFGCIWHHLASIASWVGMMLQQMDR